MNTWLLKLYIYAQALREEHGQDLIEYALVAALIAFAATLGMKTLANQINNAFLKIGNDLSSAVSTAKS